MRNYDKSLIEVWEWKEKVYHDVKNYNAKEYVEKVRNDADKILSDGGIKLASISFKKAHQKIT